MTAGVSFTLMTFYTMITSKSSRYISC